MRAGSFPRTNILVVGIRALLLLVHAALGLWAALGLAEFALPALLRIGLQNPLFPAWLQLLHWAAIGAGAAAFFACWFLIPHRLAAGMAAAYGLMALVCAIQTTGYLAHPSRYRDMVLEYVVYLAILGFLAAFPRTATAGGAPTTKPDAAGSTR